MPLGFTDRLPTGEPQSAFRPTAGQTPPLSAAPPSSGGAPPPPPSSSASVSQTPSPATANPFTGMYDGGPKGATAATTAAPAASTDPLAPYRNERITGPYTADPNDPASKAPQYDTNGIPMTQDAWNMQGNIDSGKLHELYDQLKKSGKYKDQNSLDQAVISAYLGEARKEGKNAAFMEEMLPTQVDASLGTVVGTPLGLDGPNQHPLAADKTTSMARLGDAEIAQEYEKSNPGKDMYALVVPYSNSVENIMANDGTPKDGIAKMGAYLNELDNKNVTTIATGYSQGGAAVLGYESAHPQNDQGLDYAVAMAPMGGTDQHGGTGIYSGNRDGVNTLAVSHQMDPAAGIYDSGGLYGGAHLAEGMTNFVASPNGWLHGTPNKNDARLGTYGYPTQQLMPTVDNFFGASKQGPLKPYGRDGNWNINPTGPNGQKVDWSKPGNPSVGSVLGETGTLLDNKVDSTVSAGWSGAKSLAGKAAGDGEKWLGDAGKGIGHLLGR